MGERFPVRHEPAALELDERTIDLVDPHAVEKRFIDQFPGNIDLQALHCGMALGLDARECSRAYSLGFASGSPVTGEDSLPQFSALVDNLYSIQRINTGEITDLHNRSGIWGVFHEGMRSINGELGDGKFEEYTQRVRQNHEAFLTSGRGSVSLGGIGELRKHSHQIRTVSEWMITAYLGAPDLPTMVQRSRELDDHTIRNFADIFYWKAGGGLSALHQNLRLEPDNAQMCHSMEELYRELSK